MTGIEMQEVILLRILIEKINLNNIGRRIMRIDEKREIKIIMIEIIIAKVRAKIKIEILENDNKGNKN